MIALIAHFLPGSGTEVQATTPAYDMGYALGRAMSGQSSSTDSFWVIAWTAVATALYRYEEWAQGLKRSRKLKKIARSVKLARPKVKPAPVDPVDLELDKMRANSGLIKMKKTPKKSS